LKTQISKVSRVIVGGVGFSLFWLWFGLLLFFGLCLFGYLVVGYAWLCHYQHRVMLCFAGCGCWSMLSAGLWMSKF
jgi:hypothetical protein